MRARSTSPRSRAQLVVPLALALGAVWLGCATSNGDGDLTTSPPPSSTSKIDAADRPAFEADFPDTGTSSDAASEGGGDGGACLDDPDPGGSEVTAKQLPATDDSQNSPITVSGIMAGAVDVDFYKLSVADVSLHLLQPDIKSPTAGIELCTFVKCPSGASNVTCSGGVAKNSDLGIAGCCGTGPTSATPTWNCPSTNDSAELTFRIKNTGDKCLPYSFSYAF